MSDWKINNTTLKILTRAQSCHYGVLSTIVYTLDHVIAMIRAAENKNSPLIIQMFPWAITHSNGDLVRCASALAKKSKVPVAIHLDHCQDPQMVKFAAEELPFDSIMVDMSHYEKAENLARTKELVQLCNKYHKATEAEPGRIEGGEDGISDTVQLEGILTTPEEAEIFLETGIDILSPAFGNYHGDYPPVGPQLRFDILETIIPRVEAKKAFLCLHGTNNFTPELIHKNISYKMSKINVNKLILDSHLEYFEEYASKMPLTDLLDKSNELLVERVEYWMDVFGSSGKA